MIHRKVIVNVSQYSNIYARYNTDTDYITIGFQFKKRNRQWEKNFLIKWKKVISNLKINGCAICGYNRCNTALDFHHSNPKDKKFGINTHCFQHSNKEIMEETNKCILLCKNCHYEIHEKERDNCV